MQFSHTLFLCVCVIFCFADSRRRRRISLFERLVVLRDNLDNLRIIDAVIQLTFQCLLTGVRLLQGIPRLLTAPLRILRRLLCFFRPLFRRQLLPDSRVQLANAQTLRIDISSKGFAFLRRQCQQWRNLGEVQKRQR